MIVRSKKCQRMDMLQAVFDDRPGNGHAVKGARAAADFIEDEQAVRRSVLEDIRHFLHFYHKRTLSREDIVAGPNTRKDAVYRANGRVPRRNEGACLGHEDQDCDLAHVRRFAGHIRTRNDQYLVVLVIEGYVVWHKKLITQEFFDNRVAAVVDSDAVVTVQAGPHVAVIVSRRGEAAQAVYLGNGPGRSLHGRNILLYGFTDFPKELVFQGEHPFLAGENLDFKFLQLRRNIAFGIDQGLFAHVIVRHRFRIGVGNFEIVTEDLRIADFHLNARLFLFPFFHFLEEGVAVGSNGTDFIEIGVKAVADNAAIADDQARIVLDATAEEVIDFRMLRQGAIEALQEVTVGAGENALYSRDDAQGFAQGHHVLRAGCTRFDARQNAFEIINPVEGRVQVLAHDFPLDQFFYGVLPTRNVGNAHERRFQPFAQETAAHGGPRLVEDVEKGPLAAAVADVLRNFQMAQAGCVDDQTPVVIDAFQTVDMGNIRFHDVLHVIEEQANAARSRGGSA